MRLLNKKTRRAVRTRGKMQGTKAMPRLSVHRTNKYVYAQLIDDQTHTTIVTVTEKQFEKGVTGTKTERAKQIGQKIALVAKEKKIKKAIFDRGAYAYHGRVKAIAEGAREGGLTF